MTAAQLRRELSSAAKRMLELHGEGSSGAARQLARETTALLTTSLGELPPLRRDPGLSTREIIAQIPR